MTIKGQVYTYKDKDPHRHSRPYKGVSVKTKHGFTGKTGVTTHKKGTRRATRR
jgi:hypothetical protein